MTDRPQSIAGVGIDLIEIDRLKLAHQRHGDAFFERVFTKAELEFCLGKINPFPSLAVRFAAKEAAFKALSQVGINIYKWHDISVTQNHDGAPALNVVGVSGYGFHLSMSHTKDMATAVVVVERKIGS